jgi:hypothetical protein
MRRDKHIYYPTLCEPAQSLGIVKIRTGRQHGIALSSTPSRACVRAWAFN